MKKNRKIRKLIREDYFLYKGRRYMLMRNNYFISHAWDLDAHKEVILYSGVNVEYVYKFRH